MSARNWITVSIGGLISYVILFGYEAYLDEKALAIAFLLGSLFWGVCLFVWTQINKEENNDTR